MDIQVDFDLTLWPRSSKPIVFNIGKEHEVSGGKCLKTLLGKCLKALSNYHLPMEEIWMDFSH